MATIPNSDLTSQYTSKPENNFMQNTSMTFYTASFLGISSTTDVRETFMILQKNERAATEFRYGKASNTGPRH